MKFLLVAATFACVCAAAPLGGPQPGYILDARTGTLRAVIGMPGAMQLGTPVQLPFSLESAEFNPTGTFAVAVSAEKPNHLYVIQSFANPVLTDLGAVADGSSALAVNSTGSTAVVTGPGQIQFVTGLPGSPVLGSAIATAALAGPVAAGIVDDAGQCALLATGAFETLCADGSSQRIVSQQGVQISAIGLSNQGADAVLADTAGQRILLVAGYAQSGSFATLAGKQDGINTPVGLQVNGQQAVVSDSAATALFLIDLSGKTGVRTYPLGSAPARAKFLSDRSILLLTDPTSAPFTIFDFASMQPFFIPTN